MSKKYKMSRLCIVLSIFCIIYISSIYNAIAGEKEQAANKGYQVAVGGEITLTFDDKHREGYSLYFTPEEYGMYTLYTEEPPKNGTMWIYMKDSLRNDLGGQMSDDPNYYFRENADAEEYKSMLKSEDYVQPKDYYAITGLFEAGGTREIKVDVLQSEHKECTVTFKLKKHSCRRRHYLKKASFTHDGEDYWKEEKDSNHKEDISKGEGTEKRNLHRKSQSI